MNKAVAPYCTITPTNDSGYSTEIGRYFCMFRIYYSKAQKYYIAYCSCEDYNENHEEFKNFTIEFLTYTDMNNVEIAYDKRLFEEITQSSKDMFADLVFAQKHLLGS